VVRFGLLGTGHWAAETQGAALAAHPVAELVGVWGRDPAKAGALAQRYGVRAYADVDALIGDVDAVAVALPPDVQAELAVRAARAGRHLLLDKPLALTAGAADRVVDAVRRHDVASVVFFTRRFFPDVDDFLRRTAARGGWQGARAVHFGSIFQPGNPYGASAWRRRWGGLWDVGPHVLSAVLPVLGPVDEVAAMQAPRTTTHVLLRHAGGAVSTLALTVDAPPAAAANEVVFFGDHGSVAVPQGQGTAVQAFGRAVERLVDAAGGARDADARDGGDGDPRGGAVGHACDVRFGREVVAVLEGAQTAARHGRTVRVPPADDTVSRAAG
jgi:predicted dehydrogenase